MAQMVCHAGMTPNEIAETSPRMIQNLLDYITQTGAHGKKVKPSQLETQMTPAQARQMMQERRQ